MRIHFERSGGFTGMLIATTIDTGSLSSEEAQSLLQMIETARLFELPPKLTAPDSGADRFQYLLTVDEKDRHHTVEISESSVPEELWPLLNRLTELARTSRKSTGGGN